MINRVVLAGRPTTDDGKGRQVMEIDIPMKRVRVQDISSTYRSNFLGLHGIQVHGIRRTHGRQN